MDDLKDNANKQEQIIFSGCSFKQSFQEQQQDSLNIQMLNFRKKLRWPLPNISYRNVQECKEKLERLFVLQITAKIIL